MPEKFELPQLSAREANSIVTLDEASRLNTLSIETMEEEYADLIVRLSPKRRGMRLGHALMLKKK